MELTRENKLRFNEHVRNAKALEAARAYVCVSARGGCRASVCVATATLLVRASLVRATLSLSDSSHSQYRPTLCRRGQAGSIKGLFCSVSIASSSRVTAAQDSIPD